MIKGADVSLANSEEGDGPGRMRRRRGSLVAAVVSLFALVFATAALAATGGLVQKPAPNGCVSDDGTGGGCADGTALLRASSVTISPDGKNAYATSAGSSAVTVFDRNASTGALTQKSGTDGCVSEDGSGGACGDGTALGGASSVTISPDGKNAYVASGLAVSILDRDPSTGKLTQKAGTSGCISENGTSGAPNFTPGACVDGVALNGPTSVSVSPDGKNLYVASYSSDAVSIFDRNTTTGTLTQKPGTDGCIAKTSFGGACTVGTQIDGARSVTVSPDGKSAYVAAYFSDAVSIFDRDATTGKLTQKANPNGCVSNTGSGDRCADGTALDGASSVTVSADDKNAYVTSFFSDAVTIFDRNTSTGALTQKSGTDSCISWTGTGGDCADGEALNGARSVTVSPDGKNAYVASAFSKAISILDRNASTGALTQEAGVDGCISETGTGGNCTDGLGLDGAQSVTTSPDEKNVYAAAPDSNAVTIFGQDDRKIDGKASAGETQKQKGNKIEVAVKIKANEDLKAKCWGKVSVGGKDYKLKTSKADVGTGDSATLKLKPAESKDSKKIAKGLKKKDGKAKVTAQLTDDSGNSSKTKLKIKLKS